MTRLIFVIDADAGLLGRSGLLRSLASRGFGDRGTDFPVLCIERALGTPDPVPPADYLPSLVTGWLSPWHCGIHGARVQRRLNRAGTGRWRTRAVEVRRRQPGARAARRKPQAEIVKQVRKAMRRLAREVV